MLDYESRKPLLSNLQEKISLFLIFVPLKMVSVKSISLSTDSGNQCCQQTTSRIPRTSAFRILIQLQTACPPGIFSFFPISIKFLLYLYVWNFNRINADNYLKLCTRSVILASNPVNLANPLDCRSCGVPVFLSAPGLHIGNPDCDTECRLVYCFNW